MRVNRLYANVFAHEMPYAMPKVLTKSSIYMHEDMFKVSMKTNQLFIYWSS